MSDDGDYDVDGGDFDGDDIDNDIDEAGDEVERGENMDILPGQLFTLCECHCCISQMLLFINLSLI